MPDKIWTGPDANGRLAKSLVELYSQFNELAPDRDRDYDGSIGDEAHRQRESDHNPSNGVVHAIDLTHDPEHGMDVQAIADQIRASGDRRWKYLIHNGRISNPSIQGGAWRARNKGPGDHAHHLHVSVVDGELADATDPWKITRTAPGISSGPRRPLLKQGASGEAVKELQALLGIPIDGHFGEITLGAVKQFQQEAGIDVDGDVGSQTWGALYRAKQPIEFSENIKATIFNDTTLAYGPQPADALLASLPAPFPSQALPWLWIRNRANGRIVAARVGDKGPWHTDDPYWSEASSPSLRPRAESEPNTNKAGIDLYPATATALGIPYTERDGKIIAGEGQVDWGFLPAGKPIPTPIPAPEPIPAPVPVPEAVDLASAIAALNAATAALNAVTGRLELLTLRRPPAPAPQPPAVIDMPQEGARIDPRGLETIATIMEAVIAATPAGTGVKAAAAVLRVLGTLAKRRNEQ